MLMNHQALTAGTAMQRLQDITADNDTRVLYMDVDVERLKSSYNSI